jgi:nicotinate phosphoribosyltransferase
MAKPPENPLRAALFTDLYELTMAQAYAQQGMEDEAVFELFFRELPPERNYAVAAGLDDALSYLERFRFTDDDLRYLAGLALFAPDFLERLRSLRFTGDVWAMPEGTPVFPNEPILQVVAPLVEAQLVETLLLNQIHFQTVAASKAARVVAAAQGRNVVEFGARRAHGADAALKVARASYLVGAQGTSCVLAGKRYGIPVFGTMAHSYIQSHHDELAAFEHFARAFPNTTLLVDTYDTLSGVRKVIELSRRLGDAFNVRAVRLDSGDLAALAKAARQMLDEAGLTRLEIFASSELDEHKIARLLKDGAPIDGFGVGTRMAVSADAPTLDVAYKLVAYAGRPSMKLSSHKQLYPGRKQIFRQSEKDRFARDILARHDESFPGEPLLTPMMRRGQHTSAGRATLADARARAAAELARLPETLRELSPAPRPYPVEISPRLAADRQSLQRSLEQSQLE